MPQYINQIIDSILKYGLEYLDIRNKERTYDLKYLFWKCFNRTKILIQDRKHYDLIMYSKFNNDFKVETTKVNPC